MTWMIAYTNPRAEVSACVHLAEAGYRAFAPHYYESRPLDPRNPSGGRRYVRRQVFPRYVFFRAMSKDQGVYRAAKCVGIHSLIMAADQPAIVSDEWMDFLMERVEGDGYMPDLDAKEPRKPRHKVGDTVEVAGNTLKGVVRAVAEVDGRDIYEVEIAMFGSTRTAKVSASGIAAVKA